MHWRPIVDKHLSSIDTPVLLTDPSDPNHLLIGGMQGLFESKNDGNTWQQISGVSGSVLGMVASNTTPRLIFCATDAGLYRWQEGSRGNTGNTRVTQLKNAPSGLTRLTADPTAHLLYGVVGQDLWSSTNSGTTWVRRYHFDRGDLVALVVDPWHPTHLYAGFFQPALVTYSIDGGSSWQTLTD